MKRLEKGFTLIELMIVVAIIAILAAVAAPKFGAQIKKSKDAKGVSLIGSWRSASSLFYSEEEQYANDLNDITAHLDANAKNVTFADAAGTALAATDMKMFVEVGTSGNDFTGGTASGKPYVTATYTTDGSITIDAGQGNDTKDKPWDQY